MYELTIEKILTTDKKTSKIFLDAFAKDGIIKVSNQFF